MGAAVPFANLARSARSAPFYITFGTGSGGDLGDVRLLHPGDGPGSSDAELVAADLDVFAIVSDLEIYAYSFRQYSGVQGANGDTACTVQIQKNQVAVLSGSTSVMDIAETVADPVTVAIPPNTPEAQFSAGDTLRMQYTKAQDLGAGNTPAHVVVTVLVGPRRGITQTSSN